MNTTADYAARIKALKEEQAKLAHKQADLLEKRRAEIGKLAERVGVLETTDDLIAGALLELKDALSHASDERLARWRAAGASFRRGSAPRKNGARAQAD
ncbi:MAG: conjugal transfer protein TraD [Acidimicrobiales bacterium]